MMKNKNRKTVFCEAPVCVGSPTHGSEKAYSVLKSHLSELYGEKCGFVDYGGERKLPEINCDPMLKDLETVMLVNGKNRKNVKSVLENGDFPVTVGGDHSIAVSSITAVSEYYGAENIAVIYIDGHTDINTEKTTETGYIHGMPLASVMGICCDELAIGENKKYIDGKDIHILGARSIDKGEYTVVAENNVDLYTKSDLDEIGIDASLSKVIEKVKGKKVHISFDVDSMDGAEFPSTGYVMPDGLLLNEVIHMINRILEECDVVSMDVVEYNPGLDKNGSDLDKLMRIFAGIKART